MKSHFIRSQLSSVKTVIQRGAFHIIIASFIEKFVALFGSIFVVRFLTKEAYSVFTYAYNIYSYALLAMGLGLSYGILRYVLLYNKKEKKMGCVNYAIKFGTIVNIGITLVTIIIAVFYVYPMGYEEAELLVVLMALSVPFKHLFTVMIFTNRAMMDAKRYAAYSLINSTIVILARAVSAYFGNLLIITISYVICEAIMSVVTYYIEKNHYFRSCIEESMNISEKKSMLSYSVLYMLTNGIWTMFMLNETTMLGRLSTNVSAVADYKVAYTIPACLLIFTTAIGIFVGPYFTKWDKEGDHKSIFKGYSYTLLFGIGFMLFAVFCIIAFGSTLIPLFFGEKYANVIDLTNILLFAALANSVRSLIANIFASVGRIKVNMIIAISGMVLQIILGSTIIPIYGSYGLAYMDIIIYSLMAISELIFSFYIIKKMRKVRAIPNG